jgi:glycosyltransferase involved in cell wall biosynthesis
MNVLHVVPSYYPATYWGGPIFSVYALNNALARQPDISLRVLTTDAEGEQVEERLDTAYLAGLYVNYKVSITKRVAGSSVSLELLKKLPELVRQADLVHLTGIYSFPTLPTLLLCRIFSKPLVWSPRGAILDAHEWEGSRRKRLKRGWERLCNILIRPGNKVLMHTTAERERAVTQEILTRATAMVVTNGVDVPDRLPVRDWVPDGRLRLMYLGRLAPKKGIENLLSALSLLKDNNAVLTIYGAGNAGYTAGLKLLAEQLGLLNGSVFFVGHVDGEAKRSAFVNADLCIVPSYSENFCMVVAEALAHGVPVVASHGTPWAGVEEKRCGLWVDNSPESLARAIDRIRAMPLQDLGSRGRDWMEREFSWDVSADKMVQMYRSLVAR